ncbi:MAG: hypothetical protein LBV26_01580, partial [Bacteroidales bacterium]|nr:hypothetical protein [Bacteroidales bacterium]
QTGQTVRTSANVTASKCHHAIMPQNLGWKLAMTGAVASGSAFAMTRPNTAFEITYCIFSEEV